LFLQVPCLKIINFLKKITATRLRYFKAHVLSFYFTVAAKSNFPQIKPDERAFVKQNVIKKRLKMYAKNVIP